MSVLVSALLDATVRIESCRIAFLTEGALVPTSTFLWSLAEVAARFALELLVIVRATIDGQASGARADEMASSSAGILLGIPDTSRVSRAVGLVEVAEAALLDASVVVTVPFADSTGIFASSLLSLEAASSAADVTVPDATAVEIASLAAEPL